MARRLDSQSLSTSSWSAPARCVRGRILPPKTNPASAFSNKLSSCFTSRAAAGRRQEATAAHGKDEPAENPLLQKPAPADWNRGWVIGAVHRLKLRPVHLWLKENS